MTYHDDDVRELLDALEEEFGPPWDNDRIDQARRALTGEKQGDLIVVVDATRDMKIDEPLDVRPARYDNIRDGERS